MSHKVRASLSVRNLHTQKWPSTELYFWTVEKSNTEDYTAFLANNQNGFFNMFAHFFSIDNPLTIIAYRRIKSSSGLFKQYGPDGHATDNAVSKTCDNTGTENPSLYWRNNELISEGDFSSFEGIL